MYGGSPYALEPYALEAGETGPFISLVGTGDRARTATADLLLTAFEIAGTGARQRGGSGVLTVTIPAVVPIGPGFELNGRVRGGAAVLTVTVAPTADVPELPTYTPIFPTPVTIDGIPYENSSKDPWAPDESDSHDFWGTPQILVGGKDVTTFRADAAGRPVRTVIEKWSDKSPGGDDQCDLWFPAITPRDQLSVGPLAWLRPDANVVIRCRRPDGVTIDTVYEGVVSPIEDTLRFSGTTGEPDYRLVIHCVGLWADLNRFICLPRPSIDQWITPIPNGPLTPVDTAQFIYAHVHRAYLYGWKGAMIRPANSGIPTPEQGNYGDALADRTLQDALATMQKPGAFHTVVNQRPMHLKLDTLVWGGGHYDFAFHCMQPGVTHNLTKDPTVAFNAIFGHGQAPWGPVDTAIGRPDAVADWHNWQYPAEPLPPPDYPLPIGENFVAGDGHTGFQPFSDVLNAHGYPLVSNDTYLTADFGLVERFQSDHGMFPVDGIVGLQTWLQAFQVGINSKVLAQAYIKEIVTSTVELPFLNNARGGFTGANPKFDPTGHPRREMLEQFGSLAKADAVKSAEEEWKRISAPIYRGTVTATDVDPIDVLGHRVPALDTRAGMTLDYKGHAGFDRHLFVAQVERIPGMRGGDPRAVTWTVSEQPEGLMTLAQRLIRLQGIKDLVASNRPPRHHAKLAPNYPIFDAESGAGIVQPGQGITGGEWQRILVPMGAQLDVNAVKLVADRPAKLSGCMFANPYMTIAELAALIPDPSAGTQDPFALHAAALENLGICWASGQVNGMQGYWPNDPGGTLTGVLYDGAAWQFRANAVYGALFLWADRDCAINGDPAAKYRAIFPVPSG